jgi:hypothetical protein
VIYTMEQSSPEWNSIRCGIITSSRLADVLDYLKKGGEGAGRRNYRWELIAQRLTGQPRDNGASFAARVKWGVENEPFARGAYELHAGVMVDRVGFITHPDMDFTGGSPDALVGADGVYEAKCPDSITHVQWIKAGVVPEDHIPQCLWNIECAEREWCDFMSYDPRMPEHLRKFIVRQYRDEVKLAEYRSEVARLNDEINEAINSLGGR